MILACEPICIGFEHSMVNAAMLAVFKDAFPGEELIFSAEEEHLHLVAHDPLLLGERVDLQDAPRAFAPRHQAEPSIGIFTRFDRCLHPRSR
jgi:hypothetical protein